MTPRRIPLVQIPTPLHRLDRLSDELGIDLWIKRDDLTGFGGGGNKGRKLEYLMAAALEQRAEVVVTCGTVQSNFVRQLAAACSVLGIHCAAAVMEMPYLETPPDAPPALSASGGNVLLDELLGAELRRHPNGDWDRLYELMEDLALEFERQGKSVYRIPVGGSSPYGAYAFHQAAQELPVADPFDWVVFASSSGSTHIGLTYAFHGGQTKVLGVACDPEPDIVQEFAEIGLGLATILDAEPLSASDFRMTFEYVGEGYAVSNAAADAAIKRMARTEGIILDPVYTGRAFAGLLDLATKGELTGRVLFWHTGGFPSVFAWASAQ